jgi:hypothetical protein
VSTFHLGSVERPVSPAADRQKQLHRVALPEHIAEPLLPAVCIDQNITVMVRGDTEQSEKFSCGGACRYLDTPRLSGLF